MLSVTGGVPKYLAEMNPNITADENVRRMCFLPQGFLFGDFDRIFRDVFKRTSESKRRILDALSSGPISLCGIADSAGLRICDNYVRFYIRFGRGRSPRKGQAPPGVARHVGPHRASLRRRACAGGRRARLFRRAGVSRVAAGAVRTPVYEWLIPCGRGASRNSKALSMHNLCIVLWRRF